jgi:rhodanese-related sulfurtransferase
MDPQGGEIRIEVEEARAKLEAGDAVAVDVVQPGAWAQMDSVVQGAVRIPPEEFTQRFEELPQDLELITYCT